MSETPKLTSAAYERLQAEVEILEVEGRREKADKIGVARDFGDLKENAEYHAAKEDAAMLEAKIARMRATLRSAEIVEAAEDGAAGMGSTVTWVDEASGRETTFKLVPGVEASPGDGLRSIDYALEEIVVESATYIACASAGLATDLDSVPYVAGWAGDNDPLAVVEQAAKLIDELARLIEDAIAPAEHEDAGQTEAAA